MVLPLEILTGNAGVSVYLFFLFIIFVVISYLTVKFMLRTLMFMMIGATFPLFLKYVLNLNIKITALTVLGYAVLGGVLYLCYAVLKALFTTGKVVLFIIRIISFPFRLGFRVVMFLVRKIGGGGKQKSRVEKERLEVIKSVDDKEEEREEDKRKSKGSKRRKKE